MPDSKIVRIVDFDGSLTKQNKVIAQYSKESIDLRAFGSCARLWMNHEVKASLSLALSGKCNNAINLIGSGDFHHITQILTDQIREPFTLIVFDFHPDWDTLPPRFGCGSWVTQAIKNKNLAKCLLAGVSSNDISTFSLETASLSSLSDNRLEIYPYSHGPSKVFLRSVANNISLNIERSFFYRKIYWNELKGKNLSDFFYLLVKRIPTKKVYISIDKDCLKREFALTNWEEGFLELDELLLMLRLIKDNLEIIGADIVGDYSPVSIKNSFKAFLSKLDHPKSILAEDMPEWQVNKVNEETNLKILELLTS